MLLTLDFVFEKVVEPPTHLKKMVKMEIFPRGENKKQLKPPPN